MNVLGQSGDDSAGPPSESAPLPVADGSAVLDAVVSFFERFVSLPSREAFDAVALWVVHTYAMSAAHTTPRLAVLSPEKRSGKTLLFEVLNEVVYQPLFTASLSMAGFFRAIAAGEKTVLFDEVDTIFGERTAQDHEDMRGVLNSGFRRDAEVVRCVGNDHEPKRFPVFAPVALAAIGTLPNTLMDRSIVIRMKRRLPEEKVERWRPARLTTETETLRTAIGAWVANVIGALEMADPELPDGLGDRVVDMWEPLLAIADAAGGEWPERARRAALKLNTVGLSFEDSLGVVLLENIRKIFDERGVDKVSSDSLATDLRAIEDAPWGDGGIKALTVRELARRLRPFEIRPKDIRLGGKVIKGYARCEFEETWCRYVPPSPGSSSATSATAENPETDVAVVADQSDSQGERSAVIEQADVLDNVGSESARCNESESDARVLKELDTLDVDDLLMGWPVEMWVDL